LWDAPSGKLLRTLRESGPRVSRLAFAPDGKTLAVGLANGQVTLWAAGAWREAPPIRLPGALPNRGVFLGELRFSPDSRRLLTSAEQGGMRLWEVSTGKEVWRQPAANGRAAFAPDGKTLVTGGWDAVLHFRDPATGEERRNLPVGTNVYIDDIAFAPDGRTLATCHHDAAICLRDASTGEVTRKLTGHRDVVWELSFSPDSKWILSTGCDHSVRLHEVASGLEVLRLDGHDGRVYHGQLGPDGRTALTAAWDLTALFWSLRPSGVPAAKGDEEKRWTDLGSDNGPAAYRAVWALLDDPDTAAGLLRRKLAPAPATVDRAAVLKAIADLDADDFATREAAGKALAGAGPGGEPLLREALAKPRSAEQRRRLESLLADLKHEPTPDDWRVMRAVQALELGGTPRARAVLREWAGGARGALLTEQAREALGRLR
jgi:hypothetical protein